MGRTLLYSILAGLLTFSTVVAQECFGNATLNQIFATDDPTCCQNDVCAIPCPEPVSEPTKGESSHYTLYNSIVTVVLFYPLGSFLVF
jgi:hypothetical protein